MTATGRSIQFRTGYKEGGGVKKEGIIRRTLSKIRKKILPTFGEQHETATKAGKKEFTSTRATEKGGSLFSQPKGKLHYAATKKADVAKKIAKSKAADLKAKEGKGGGADSGSKKKAVYEKATGTKVSKKGQAFSMIPTSLSDYIKVDKQTNKEINVDGFETIYGEKGKIQNANF